MWKKRGNDIDKKKSCRKAAVSCICVLMLTAAVCMAGMICVARITSLDPVYAQGESVGSVSVTAEVIDSEAGTDEEPEDPVNPDDSSDSSEDSRNETDDSHEFRNIMTGDSIGCPAGFLLLAASGMLIFVTEKRQKKGKNH